MRERESKAGRVNSTATKKAGRMYTKEAGRKEAPSKKRQAARSPVPLCSQCSGVLPVLLSARSPLPPTTLHHHPHPLHSPALSCTLLHSPALSCTTHRAHTEHTEHTQQQTAQDGPSREAYAVPIEIHYPRVQDRLSPYISVV